MLIEKIRFWVFENGNNNARGLDYRPTPLGVGAILLPAAAYMYELHPTRRIFTSLTIQYYAQRRHGQRKT
jgi:hypothetical protein